MSLAVADRTMLYNRKTDTDRVVEDECERQLVFEPCLHLPESRYADHGTTT